MVGNNFQLKINNDVVRCDFCWQSLIITAVERKEKTICSGCLGCWRAKWPISGTNGWREKSDNLATRKKNISFFFFLVFFASFALRTRWRMGGTSLRHVHDMRALISSFVEFATHHLAFLWSCSARQMLQHPHPSRSESAYSMRRRFWHLTYDKFQFSSPDSSQSAFFIALFFLNYLQTVFFFDFYVYFHFQNSFFRSSITVHFFHLPSDFPNL